MSSPAKPRGIKCAVSVNVQRETAAGTRESSQLSGLPARAESGRNDMWTPVVAIAPAGFCRAGIMRLNPAQSFTQSSATFGYDWRSLFGRVEAAEPDRPDQPRQLPDPPGVGSVLLEQYLEPPDWLNALGADVNPQLALSERATRATDERERREHGAAGAGSGERECCGVLIDLEKNLRREGVDGRACGHRSAAGRAEAVMPEVAGLTYDARQGRV